MRILVTGAAGFIGAALALRLLDRGDEVIGVDNLNTYYDVNLKKARLARLQAESGFSFRPLDLVQREAVRELFAASTIHRVVNLAAQAGVRYSLENPGAYIDTNLVGFANVLEGARHAKVEHFVFASSSSVYGANTSMPFSERQSIAHPLTLYGATKKANELMAHSYAHLFRLPCTGLRFFTVYGPWGRPDMALFKFTAAILKGEPITVFNEGRMVRDFTYIDDIIEGIVRVLDHPATSDPEWTAADPNPAVSSAPYRVFNIGNNRPVELMHYIRVLEDCLGIKAVLELLPMQPGDVPATSADVSLLEAWVGFRPRTAVEEGVAEFVKWYKDYFKPQS